MLDRVVNILIDGCLFFAILLPFFNTGVTSDDFSIRGKVPNWIMELTNPVTIFELKSDVTFNIKIGMLPLVFFVVLRFTK